MAITENEINALNNFLESDSFDIVEFEKLFQSIKARNNFKTKLIDFEYYNETRLEEAKKEIIICLEKKYFEKAVVSRNLELECQIHIDLKSELNIQKSAFHYEHDHLIYFHLGTARNDKLIREYLKKGMR